MSNTFTVSFFGHRWVADLKFIDREISKIIEKIIKTEDDVKFLVGRNCDFDVTVSKTINHIQKYSTNNNITHICVLPLSSETYNDDNYEFYFHYGDVEITYTSVEVISQSSVQIRKMDMVNRSNLCVFYVDMKHGRAWQTMQYALSQNKSIINIADFITPHNFTPSLSIW